MRSSIQKGFNANFASIRQLADKFDYFLFDCDGVVWHGEETHIGEAFRNIEWLESIGKKVFFVTNNASISRATMKKKMETQFFNYTPNIDHLYPSSTLAAQYVKQKLPEVKKVRVLGMDSLCEELELAGIQHCGGQEPDKAFDDVNYFKHE